MSTPSLVAPIAISNKTLFASPTQAIFRPSRPRLEFDGVTFCGGGRASWIVRKSAIACNGWNVSQRALMTGTVECLESSAISECGPTRATMQDTIEDITTDVS
ncbi:hypothetical protein I7I48_06647 [Histoplasma ohiense]|nr:hypothetical protein I7I48_06647 [Histoplasma ohiense (nom. inval.)]